MALNDGRLTTGRNSFGFIEKKQTVYDFSLETDRHPPSIHLFWRQTVNQSVLYQTNERAGA